jgi:hypothetical protein
MKAISIQQPWGTLIAHGVKDVENRTSRMLVPPQRVLIHVGAKMREPDLLNNLFVCWELPVENAETIGQFDRNEELPLSAIIGYVDVVDIVEDSTSVWAQYAPEGEKPMLHYVLKNAHLFKQPILNVKGRLGVWNIPEIDENNLPETVDIPKIERKGKTLTIPCGGELWCDFYEWQERQEDEEFEVTLNLLEENMHLFTDEELNPLATNKLILTRNGSKFEAKVDDILVEDVMLDDTGEYLTYEDPAGNELNAMTITFILSHK